MMTNDLLEKFSTIDDDRGKLNTIRLTLGLKILVILAVLLAVSYQLFFVYVQPDQYGIKVVRN